MAGSSPRAWGLYGHRLPPLLQARFIPTCVGFIGYHYGHHARKTVHPHVRGVYAVSLPMSLLTRGSSPRAWGLLLSRIDRGFHHRFIPTCVGFIFFALALELRQPVHPHVRGVYVSGAKRTVYGVGSSPRAWGLSQPHDAVFVEHRFIPTCVGFIWRKRRRTCCSAVHPHVRGVYQTTKSTKTGLFGSSPRAWGLCELIPFYVDEVRFIPTCVGFMLKSPRQQSEKSVHPHVRGVYDDIC